MKKIYRISVYNKTENRRELLYVQFTSKLTALEFANEVNKNDNGGTVCAYVVEQ